MARKKTKARRRVYTPMSFKELCDTMGIDPRQRIQILRYMKDKISKVE